MNTHNQVPRRNRANHPSRTRLHRELGDTRRKQAEIDEHMGYRERTFTESSERRRSDRAIDRRRKWGGRLAVAAAAVGLGVGVYAAGRAIDQASAEKHAENGDVPHLIHQRTVEGERAAAARAADQAAQAADAAQQNPDLSAK